MGKIGGREGKKWEGKNNTEMDWRAYSQFTPRPHPKSLIRRCMLLLSLLLLLQQLDERSMHPFCFTTYHSFVFTDFFIRCFIATFVRFGAFCLTSRFLARLAEHFV